MSAVFASIDPRDIVEYKIVVGYVNKLIDHAKYYQEFPGSISATTNKERTSYLQSLGFKITNEIKDGWVIYGNAYIGAGYNPDPDYTFYVRDLHFQAMVKLRSKDPENMRYLVQSGKGRQTRRRRKN